MKGKNFLGLMLAGLTMTTAMAGCGKKVDSDSEQTLEIYICAQGRGDEWLYTSAEKFANSAYVKEKYPNFEYDITSNSESAFAQNQIESGGTKYDILTVNSGLPKLAATPGLKGSVSLLENLNDVYESKIPQFNGSGYEKNAEGQEWTVREKLEKGDPTSVKYAAKSEYNANGEQETNYYYVPWQPSVYGIIYNRTNMLKYGYLKQAADGSIEGVPRTTAELKKFAEKIANDGKVPFSTSDEDGYWMRVQNVWWVQYDGEEAFEKFFEGKVQRANGRWEVDIDVLNSRGRLLANKTTESYLSLNNNPNLCHTDSAALSYTDSQSYLLQGKSFMIACGDWLDYEMRDVLESSKEKIDLGMMAVPMLSEVIEVVPDKSIADDVELSALVGAIRAGASELSGTFEGVAYDVSQKDFDYIKDYDGIYASGESIVGWAIPSYSPAKELAKDFLRYIATDEFSNEYIKVNQGASSSFYYDAKTQDPALYATFSTLQYDAIAYKSGRRGYMPYKTTHNPLIYLAGFNSFAEPMEASFVASNPADRKTAEQIIQNQIKNYSANNNKMWDSLFVNAGLK